MWRNYLPLSSDLGLVVHEHVHCVMQTGRFNPVFHNFAQVTAVFWFFFGIDSMLMTELVYHFL